MTFLLWAISIYACALGLAAIVLSLLFWYEATNHPCPQIPPPAYRPLPVIQTVIRYFFFHAIRPGIALAWFCLPKRQPAHSPHPPVVLIHGIFSTRTSWYFFYKALARENFSITTFGYGTLWGSTNATIARLEKHIHKVRQRTGSDRVIIVAHSLGGVVARYWLAKYPQNVPSVAGLITLCTPHRGSSISTLLPNPFARAVTPGSTELQTIASQSYTSFPCIAYATNADTLVIPAERLLPPENWTLHVTPPIDHLETLANKRVIEAVITDLKNLTETPTIGKKASTSPIHSTALPDSASRSESTSPSDTTT